MLVRVVSLATEYWPALMSPYPAVAQAAIDGEMTEAELYLQRLAYSKLLTGITVTTAVHYGPAAPTILATATVDAVDLIIMGSHGSTGISHWMLGSVAEKVIRYAPVPVLIWRAGIELPLTGVSYTESPLRVLVPLDGSSYAEAALEPAAHLLSALKDSSQKGALHLARIVKPPVGDLHDEMYTVQTREGLNTARQSLSHITAIIREGAMAPAIAQERFMVNWSVALDQDVAGALVRLAENGEDMEGMGAFGGCALIAMATHGRGGLERWAMGSITERVLHASRLPLLIVHPTETVAKKPEGDREVLSAL